MAAAAAAAAACCVDIAKASCVRHRRGKSSVLVCSQPSLQRNHHASWGTRRKFKFTPDRLAAETPKTLGVQPAPLSSVVRPRRFSFVNFPPVLSHGQEWSQSTHHTYSSIMLLCVPTRKACGYVCIAHFSCFAQKTSQCMKR